MQPSFPPPDEVVNDAARGFIAAPDRNVIRTSDGRPVWNLEQFKFLEAEECPDTIAPMLWRQAQLCLPNGLFLVTEGIYQIRGIDAANMTMVEGTQGVIVIDTLMSEETAAEGLRIYRQHRGERDVTAVIYTHPHGDHYGGSRGVLPAGKENIPIYAPQDFLHHAVSESVIAGSSMGRRSAFQFGGRLERGPRGHICCGTCLGTSNGTQELIPPNVHITHTGQTEIIDGIKFVFQMTPGAEAPAEMNFLIPQRRALCIAENASQSLHNLTPLRGSLVRDAQVWSQYLDETIVLFCQDTDVCFGGHNWPTWGKDAVQNFLSEQRDLYAYIHDQTILMMSRGLTGTEIAEELELPAGLRNLWHTQDFYGCLNQNVKSIYTRYMGWYDGNPAHLWEHPPVELAQRYIYAMGGTEQALSMASHFTQEGDLRFAATLLNHVVFATPENIQAKEALAAVYEQLAWSRTCAPWRDSYLVAALELREGVPEAAGAPTSDGVLVGASIEQVLSSFAVRIDGHKAQHASLAVYIDITDCNERHSLILSNGALIRRNIGVKSSSIPGPHCSLTKSQLVAIVKTSKIPDGVGAQAGTGFETLQQIVSFMELPKINFNIVTP